MTFETISTYIVISMGIACLLAPVLPQKWRFTKILSWWGSNVRELPAVIKKEEEFTGKNAVKIVDGVLNRILRTSSISQNDLDMLKDVKLNDVVEKFSPEEK